VTSTDYNNVQMMLKFVTNNSPAGSSQCVNEATWESVERTPRHQSRFHPLLAYIYNKYKHPAKLSSHFHNSGNNTSMMPYGQFDTKMGPVTSSQSVHPNEMIGGATRGSDMTGQVKDQQSAQLPIP